MKPFTPPGFVRVADIDDRSTMRERLAIGELEAVVWNPATGELTEIWKDFWLKDWSAHLIASGVFLNGIKREPLPVLLKVPAPAASAAPVSGKRGPKISVLERVKREMQLVGLETVRGMKEVEMECRFKASRDTCRRALKASSK
jgi:hypothetical protein